MRYWMYKCNVDGGPAGYWGDWVPAVFERRKKEFQWGGHYSTWSPEVARRLDDDVASGDVVVAYQTNEQEVVGFCVITRITGAPGDRKLWLAPIHRLDPGFRIHAHKHGTVLEDSIAVNGMVMLRELKRPEMKALVAMSGTPKSVLSGNPPAGGYRPT